MEWYKNILTTDTKFLKLSIILLVITCHFTIFGASLSVVLLYLSLFAYWIIRKSFVTSAVQVWLGYAVFFAALLTADILSDKSADSVTLFFQKRLPLWSLGLVLPIAFNSIDDVKQLIRLFLFAGTATALGSIFYYILIVMPEGGRLLMFTHYMTSGGMTMMLSLILLAFSIGGNIPRNWRILSLIGLLICLIALVATSTRSSWLGFLLGASVIGILMKKELIYIMIVGVIAFFFLAPLSVQDRIESIWNPSHPNNVGRLHMWGTGIEIWKDNIWFGVGDHDLKSVYAEYKKPGDNETGGHLHNTIVMWLVTTGIIGFAAVLFFIFTVTSAIIKTIKLSDDWFSKALGSGILACFSGFLLNGLFEWNFGDSEIVTYISVLLGLCWIIYQSKLKSGNLADAV